MRGPSPRVWERSCAALVGMPVSQNGGLLVLSKKGWVRETARPPRSGVLKRQSATQAHHGIKGECFVRATRSDRSLTTFGTRGVSACRC
jgi:hypothetical protein